MPTIHITTPTGLQNMNNDLTADYILDNNLDMTGVTWVPVGTNSDASHRFTGTFDGQNFTISNLTYDDTVPALNLGGLFGYVQSGTIQNLILQNIKITSGQAFGSLCGYAVTTTGNALTITNVTANTVTLINNGVGSVFEYGGLIGYCFGKHGYPLTISACSVNGVTINCSSSGDASVGGFIGECDIDSAIADSVITNCYAKGVSITAVASSSAIGGFLGFGQGTISQCYASGTVTGVNSEGGGFVGELLNTYSVKNCYANVNVTGDNVSDLQLGGFVGYMSGGAADIIQNCYATGNIVGGSTGLYMGGFIGEIAATASTVQNCYSVGIVTGNSAALSGIGGFIGRLDNLTNTISNCAEWTGAASFALGLLPNNTQSSLATQTYGTDEPNNTNFYSKTHAVYTGGTPWSFVN